MTYTTRLTTLTLALALMAAVWWNAAPSYVRFEASAAGRWRYVKVGPGWPIPTYRYEIEWWGPEPSATALLRPPEEDSPMIAGQGPADGGRVAGYSGYRSRGLSFLANGLVVGSLCVSLLLTVRRGIREGRRGRVSAGLDERHAERDVGADPRLESR